MRLTQVLCTGSLLTSGLSMHLQKRDADFLSVRRKQQKDMSGRGGDPKDKYFHESIFHPHYDGRFTDHVLDYPEQKRALKNLLQTYLATFSDLGIETWLMHGTLLGWWWNRQILPWDSDVDVQVSEASMFYLAAYYNMSVFHYSTPRIPDGRDYMLEVNPHYKIREQTDRLNVIDARWIDTESGLFIDITTVRYNLTHPKGEGMLSCKDRHEYRDTSIFPLRDTIFEDSPVKIPYKFKEVLEAEYGKRSLVNTDFNKHIFDEQKMEWIPKHDSVKAPKKQKKPPAADANKGDNQQSSSPDSKNDKPTEEKKESAKPTANAEGQHLETKIETSGEDHEKPLSNKEPESRQDAP